MICWDLMPPVVAMAVALCAGLLALFRHGGIEFKVLDAGLVAAVMLGVVAPLHGAALFAVEPDGKALVVESEQVSLITDLGGWMACLASGFGAMITGVSGKGSTKEQG